VFFTYTFEELVTFLPTAVPDGSVEALVNPKVRVAGDIAMIWSDYTFTINGELSHCGTDHFDLVRQDGVWRVLNLTWTTRYDGCEALMAVADDPSSPMTNIAEDYTVAWNTHSSEAVASFFAEDGQIVINGGDPYLNRAGVARMASGFFADVPDLHLRSDGFERAGDHAIYRWTFTGTYRDTGRPLRVSGWEEWDLKADGRIARSRGWFDAAAYARQTGAARWTMADAVFFPADRALTHAKDGVVLADGRLLVGDWDHGLIALSPDGTKRPFGNFAAAGFRTKPDPLWNSPNGVSWDPDGRHVLVADITGGHIYRVDIHTEMVRRIYDHPFGVNAVVRDPSGAIWFTQSTENPAGEDSEARMFAAADKPLGDGAVWRISPEDVGKPDPVAIKVVDDLDFANGIAFDAARGRLYVAEIVANRVLSFAVDPESGALSDRRVLAELPTPDNLELDGNGNLWAVSPFANTVYVIDPETGAVRKVFEPTPEASAKIVAETMRRQAEGDPILPLLTPDMWGPMPGLITGVIFSPNEGAIYVSNLGDTLIRLDRYSAQGE
jgi:sugar lactone lactonase YvrE